MSDIIESLNQVRTRLREATKGIGEPIITLPFANLLVDMRENRCVMRLDHFIETVAKIIKEDQP